MIITGAQAVIKDTAISTLIPNTKTEGILRSVDVAATPRLNLPVRGLRSTRVRGVYQGVRKPFTIKYEILTTPAIADTYFRRALVAAQAVTGKNFNNVVPTHNSQPFVPVSIGNVSWQQAGEAPALFNITFDYFHAGGDDVTDIEPYAGQLFSSLESEIELDITPDGTERIPIEQRSFDLNGNYETKRTLDGYAGIRYSYFTLDQTIILYDDAYEFEYPYDSYLDPYSVNGTELPKEDYVTTGKTSSLASGGHRVHNITRSGTLLPSSYSVETNSIGVFE